MLKNAVVFYSDQRARRPIISRARLVLTWGIFFFVLLSVLTIWWVDRQLSRPLKEWAELQVQNLGKRAATTAMQEVLTAQLGTFEEQFIQPVPGEDGRTAWRFDWAKLNMIQTELTTRVLQNLDTMLEENIPVPLGTLLGMDLFAGLGPLVPTKIVPAGGIQTELQIVFESVGINQVRHHIELVVDLDMRVIAPLVSSHIHVREQFPLDTIILQGEIPQVYLNWGSGSLDEFMGAGLHRLMDQAVGR